MTDDPRIEAAAHVLRKYFPTAGDGLALRIAEEQLAAADRAAWRLGPPPRDRRVYLAANDSWVYTTTWHQSRGWIDGGPTYAAIPYSEEPLCHQPLPAPPEDSDDG